MQPHDTIPVSVDERLAASSALGVLRAGFDV